MGFVVELFNKNDFHIRKFSRNVIYRFNFFFFSFIRRKHLTSEIFKIKEFFDFQMSLLFSCDSLESYTHTTYKRSKNFNKKTFSSTIVRFKMRIFKFKIFEISIRIFKWKIY